MDSYKGFIKCRKRHPNLIHFREISGVQRGSILFTEYSYTVMRQWRVVIPGFTLFHLLTLVVPQAHKFYENCLWKNIRMKTMLLNCHHDHHLISQVCIIQHAELFSCTMYQAVSAMSFSM